LEPVRRDYPDRPIVGIGVVVLRPDAVLLVRRGRPPALGEWSVPGGAQELGETVEHAARRELLEETGLAVGPLSLIAHVDSIHRDDTGRVRFHYTIIDFAALWIGGDPVPGDDVSELAWTPFATLESLGLWDEALRVIALARTRLGL
jgi:ADP-ribose pyrophosphatase YjhB (NUDIX family)